jgi:hypothetical protein
MSVQFRHTKYQFGVRVGDTVVPAESKFDAERLARLLRDSGPVLVGRRVKTVEHVWEEIR